MTGDTTVRDLAVSVYTVPTDRPEADGTLQWSETTLVVAEPTAGDHTGLGWTYGPAACATVLTDLLRDQVVGGDALDVPGLWLRMVRRCRNAGRPGITSMAVAAADIALWDLKAKLLGLPLCRLLGQARTEVPVYGSGGFTTYDEGTLIDQLRHWTDDLGISRVKIKIGESWGGRPDRDLARTATARRTVGPDTELYVDANGGYTRGQALRMAGALADHDVTWFEEPVSSDDLPALAALREQVTPDVTAGEYGYDLHYFERMCAAGAVDCLQADVTRCAGITEWLRAAAVAAAHGLQVSGHCAPSLHAHPAAAIPNLRHLEFFHDHARIEGLLFDGALDPTGGTLHPDQGRPGLGLHLDRAAAEPYRRR
ncbi:MAG TPA: enolase C-terminal domain-like protein [Mycobacteriales bacterium]|nr:enolase C-terminal domain-like protein [Mycobacteriales bacterium]